MIHVATVHWRSARWIDIQARFLQRCLGDSHRVYAFLNEVPDEYSARFFYVSREKIKAHPTKLNLLCDVIRVAADPADLLLVLDGDAFPVAPIAPLVERRLPAHRLIAVQRYENEGELQPHPCFCLTTVGFWTEIGGDWHKGHEWRDLHGRPVTDVGGNLLARLESAGVDWYPLRRVNRVDLDPVFYGLYGDRELGPLVYHHGAAFRPGMERAHYRALDGSPVKASILGRQSPFWRLLGARHPHKRRLMSLKSRKGEVGDELLRRAAQDEGFWRALA